MEIKKAKFLTSAYNLSQCPGSDLAEFALIGRSNVGKSSFINKISNNSKLAKISNNPGKTRLINLFEFNEKFILADLPGYGYAKVSKTEQNKWQKNLEEYLLKRKNLKGVLHFIDARHDIQKNDFQMSEWLSLNSVYTINILTKCDYISKNQVTEKIKDLKRHFNNEAYPFSIKSNFYVKPLLDELEKFI